MSNQQLARRSCYDAMRPRVFGCIVTMVLIASCSTSSWAFDPSELVIGTDDLYGFTSGSDIGDAGARAVAVGSTWALGKSAGRYRAGATNFDFRYNVSDDLQIGIAARVDSYSIHNVPDLTNQNFTSFGGVTPSLRYLCSGWAARSKRVARSASLRLPAQKPIASCSLPAAWVLHP